MNKKTRGVREGRLLLRRIAELNRRVVRMETRMMKLCEFMGCDVTRRKQK